MLNLIFQNKYKPLTNKFNYVINNFLTNYNINTQCELYFGRSKKSNKITISPGKDLIKFFTSEDTVPENYNFIEWENQRIPILFTESIDKPIFTLNQTGQSLKINYDILSSAFYFLSCWQEWNSNKVDKIGRFPADESFLFQHNLLDIPIVNYYFDILKRAIEKHNSQTINLKNKYIKAFVTHDIDQCKTGWKQNSGRAMMEGHPWIATKTVINKIFDKDVWFNFEKMLAIEKEYNIKSTYFFLPTKNKVNNINNADYDINSSEIQNVIKKIKDNGHEIGIHGSYDSGFNKKLFLNNLGDFPLDIKGNRFHFLAMNIPQTYNILESADIKYDTTLGFAEHIGFRSGYCYPYNPYDIKNDNVFNFVEFPLMVMDRTLDSREYMNLVPDQALDKVKNIISEIDRFKGSFVFLWHNKFMSGYKFSQWHKFYLQIIQILQNHNSEFLTPGKLQKNNVK